MNVTRMWSGRSLCKRRFGIGSALALLLFLLLTACKSGRPPQNESTAPPKDSLQLTFTYGSEKEKWIDEVTAAFNQADHRTSGGKRVYVRAFPMGSGEAIDEVMDGRRQPDIISPASV